MEESNCNWCNEAREVREVISGLTRLHLCFDCIGILTNISLSQLDLKKKSLVFSMARREVSTRIAEQSFRLPSMDMKADRWIT